MKYKARELDGWQLDAATATAEGYQVRTFNAGIRGVYRCDGWAVKNFIGYLSDNEPGPYYMPSRQWLRAGPIIEREQISINWPERSPVIGYEWHANIAREDDSFNCYGPTPLVAAMRAFVLSKLGEEIEL